MQLLTKCQILGQKSSPPPPPPPTIPKMKSILLLNYQVPIIKRLITQSQYLCQYPIPECQNQNSKCLEKSQYANYLHSKQHMKKSAQILKSKTPIQHNSNIQTLMASNKQISLTSDNGRRITHSQEVSLLVITISGFNQSVIFFHKFCQFLTQKLGRFWRNVVFIVKLTNFSFFLASRMKAFCSK